MKFEITENGQDLLWPAAQRALRDSSDLQSFHDEWGFRPPLGIYNVSLLNLPRRFVAVLDELDKVKGKIIKDTKDAAAPLLDAHQALLYSIEEYLEDCDHVAKVFFSKQSQKEGELLRYRASMRPHFDRIGRAVNAVKHRQARLGIFQAHTSMLVMHGYVVWTAVGGVVGPDPAVHKDRNTAISFNFELRYLFFLVYLASFRLSLLVDELAKRRGVRSKRSEAETTAEKACGWAYDIAARIVKLLPYVFPDERNAPIPKIGVGVDPNKGRWISIDYEVRKDFMSFEQMPGRPVMHSISFMGDGVSKTFKIPYFQKKG